MLAGLEEVEHLAKRIIKEGEFSRIWTFTGDLGTGKTTLIKQICRELGTQDTVKSPTFNIVHEYAIPSKHNIFHFDFYRIEDEEEALDIGLDDYFYSGSICLIEWPEIIHKYLPHPYLEVHIEHADEGRKYDFLRR